MIEQAWLLDHETADTLAQQLVRAKRIPRKKVVYTELPDKREVPCVRYEDVIEAVQSIQAHVSYRIQNNWASILEDMVYCLRGCGTFLFDEQLVQLNQKQKRYEKRVWASMHDPFYYTRKRAADRRWRLAKKAKTDSD